MATEDRSLLPSEVVSLSTPHVTSPSRWRRFKKWSASQWAAIRPGPEARRGAVWGTLAAAAITVILGGLYIRTGFGYLFDFRLLHSFRGTFYSPHRSHCRSVAQAYPQTSAPGDRMYPRLVHDRHGLVGTAGTARARSVHGDGHRPGDRLSRRHYRHVFLGKFRPIYTAQEVGRRGSFPTLTLWLWLLHFPLCS